MNVVPQDWAGHSAILNGGLLVSLQWTCFTKARPTPLNLSVTDHNGAPPTLSNLTG